MEEEKGKGFVVLDRKDEKIHFYTITKVAFADSSLDLDEAKVMCKDLQRCTALLENYLKGK